MFRLLVLASVIATCAGEADIETADSGVFLRSDEIRRKYEKGRGDDDRNEQPRIRYDHDGIRQQHYRVNVHDDDSFRGPVILRSTSPQDGRGNGPDIARQNKIIADVFSPDYYQPTWILDYRYLKTGGRDYTRGPGGQILILPKNIHTDEHKEFRDYDSLLEHLRLKNMAEKNEMRQRYTEDEKKEEITERPEPVPKYEPKKTQEYVWKPNNYRH